jgi:tungstate transport system substrate-binding protein
VAGEKRAYALSDEATFRAFRQRTGLVALTQPEPELRNVYSVLRPNPAKLPAGRIDVAGGTRFADFLASDATAARIRAFGADGGAPLFTPLGTAAPSP